MTSNEARGRACWLAARAGALATLIAVLFWPLGATLTDSIRGDREGWTGGGLLDASAFGREASLLSGPAMETVRVSGVAVAVALAVGVPLALGMSRTDLPGRTFLQLLMALAVFVPLPVYASGWLGGFGNAGYRQFLGEEPLLSGWAGAALVHGLIGAPWVALLSQIGLRAVEPELEESALIDLPGWKVLGLVTLRRGVGAILGSAVLVLVLTAGDMTITDILIVRTYAEEAYVQFSLGRSPGTVALISVPSALAIGALLLVGARFVLRADPSRIASASDRARRWRLGRWRWVAGPIAWVLAAMLFGPPLLATLWRAGRVGGNVALGEAPTWSADGLLASLSYAAAEVRGPLIETAGMAALAAMATAIIAWILAWQASGPGAWRWLVVGSTVTLLALPGPASGMALKIAYVNIPLIHDTGAIVILGYIARTLPFAILVLWPAVRGVPSSLLDSAEVDGWDVPGRLLRIALPMTAGAMAAAWLVSFVLALGELPITNLVASAGMDPLPVFLWGQLHFGVDSRISAIGLVLIFVYAPIGVLGVAAIRWAYSRMDSHDHSIIK